MTGLLLVACLFVAVGCAGGVVLGVVGFWLLEKCHGEHIGNGRIRRTRWTDVVDQPLGAS